MDSLYTYLMILQTLLFVTLWVLVDLYVISHGPVTWARNVTWLNSWLYSLASLALTILILSPAHGDTPRYLYHASKFWEYIDVLGVRAAGGTIDLHFGFHHLTTPYLTFFRVLQHSEGWRFPAAANAWHHALMYAYFGGLGFLRPALDATGTAQLVAGIGTDAWLLWMKMGRGGGGGGGAGGPLWPHVFGIGLMSTYLGLWLRDLRMRRREKGQTEVREH